MPMRFVALAPLVKNKTMNENKMRFLHPTKWVKNRVPNDGRGAENTVERANI
jgi:hypothetical protein